MRKTFNPRSPNLVFSLSELSTIGGGDAEAAHNEIFRFALRLKEENAPSAKKIVDPKDVRLAVPEDRRVLSELMTSLHAENGLFPLSVTKRERLLDNYYGAQGAIIGVIGEVGAPVAAIYLAIMQTGYSDAWGLAEEFNYVAPEFRRADYAQQLISYAKKMSDGMKLPLLIGILSNHRTEAKVRLYERSLQRVGAYFTYGLEYIAKGEEA